MTVIAISGLGEIFGLVVLAAVMVWLLGRGEDEGPRDPDDPHAPDEDGFIPADKYGYGYDYSWGDPYGDPDL